MCGIFGVVSEKSKDIVAPLASMIRHRGPDDDGYFEEGLLKLFFFRLAIQDLTANGHQPMISNDGRYVILLNGEIYNHKELRSQLSIPVDFKSTGDTETILYAYIEWGEKVFSKLNGIFAIAIYDRLEKELMIVRDQFGVKPLYYFKTTTEFGFSSELKSLFGFPGLDLEIDFNAMMNYLQLLWSPGELTPFKNIHKLLPGHILKINLKNHIEFENYAYYQIPFNGIYAEKTEAAWIDEIEVAMLKAIERQLLADVPIGYFISGGLDSSLIVAMARKLNPNLPIKGFTIDSQLSNQSEGFEDDLPFAKEVARILNIDLQIIDGQIGFLENLDFLVWSLDEPQADIASLYVSKIAKAAREQGIVVLLSGVGGDELFAGYRRHLAVKWDAVMFQLPNWIRIVLYKFLGGMKPKGASFRRIVKFFARYKNMDLKHCLAEYYTWLDTKTVRSLFRPEIQNQLADYEPIQTLINSMASIQHETDPLNKLLYCDIMHFLSDHNLNYTDKMGMRHGVEIRVPILDIDLVELSARIPPGLKTKNGIPKYLLKKVAERYLPKEIIYRSKTGFGGPIRKWVIQDYYSEINSILSKNSGTSNQIFNPSAIADLLVRNKDHEVDASYSIFGILLIQKWMERFAK
ncbi:MAG: asparagine synthase (glutamine-hydrolyzing) [Saprospiraceae bacterium]